MDSTPLYTALQGFANAVTAKTTQITRGAPEDQLRGPFETFMDDCWPGTRTGTLSAQARRPCPTVWGGRTTPYIGTQLLAGYVELKAPGIGATASQFRGHDRDQFKRFSRHPEHSLHRRQ